MRPGVSAYPLGVHTPSRPSRCGSRRRARSARATATVILLAVAFVATGCTVSASPSFDPSAPCTADARVAGAYPALEALVPKTLGGRPPTRLDSGRNCTATNLGTLVGRGFREVRFAGGVWEKGSTSGVTLAVFETAGLTAANIGEWYEASARQARRTGRIEPSRPILDGRQAFRLDLVNDDSPQTVIAWPSPDGRVVRVVIAAGVGEPEIQAAIAAFD